jgi:hypothetical protein
MEELIFSPKKTTLDNLNKLSHQQNKFYPLDEVSSRTTLYNRIETGMNVLHFTFHMNDEEKFKYGLDFMLKHTKEGQELLDLYETAKASLFVFFFLICHFYIFVFFLCCLR